MRQRTKWVDGPPNRCIFGQIGHFILSHSPNVPHEANDLCAVPPPPPPTSSNFIFRLVGQTRDYPPWDRTRKWHKMPFVFSAARRWGSYRDYAGARFQEEDSRNLGPNEGFMPFGLLCGGAARAMIKWRPEGERDCQSSASFLPWSRERSLSRACGHFKRRRGNYA